MNWPIAKIKLKVEDNVRISRSHSRKGKIKLFGKDRMGPFVEIVWEDGEVTQESEEDLEIVNDQLDQEFNKIQVEVNEKLVAAAALVRQAADLSKKTKNDLLDSDAEGEGLFDTYALESAMRYAGWSTSSWHC